MKSSEFITEESIAGTLRSKGYMKLGSGIDAEAWLAPDGTVLKLIATTGKNSFITFANYCMANPNNPFLPKFGGWQTFKLPKNMDGHTEGLQIRTERLFEIPRARELRLREILYELAHVAKNFTGSTAIDKLFARRPVDQDDLAQLIILLGGEQELVKLIQTINDLGKIAEKNGYSLDLHPGNYMLSSDGHIVINDPFYG